MASNPASPLGNSRNFRKIFAISSACSQNHLHEQQCIPSERRDHTTALAGQRKSPSISPSFREIIKAEDEI
jgi:hypothetical protein